MSETPSSKRVTINLTTRAVSNLEKIQKRHGVDQTTAINSALNLMGYLLDEAGYAEELDINGTRYVFI